MLKENKGYCFAKDALRNTLRTAGACLPRANFFAGIHQHKATCAIGVFCHPWIKTCLAKESGLLITGTMCVVTVNQFFNIPPTQVVELGMQIELA